ncbi:MAG: hypothetical protein J7647_24820 [Cyanobacteria bacterium SBLK]|nr:hypothetical protein [Cyanobacteria bacterium SBLK]
MFKRNFGEYNKNANNFICLAIFKVLICFVIFINVIDLLIVFTSIKEYWQIFLTESIITYFWFMFAVYSGYLILTDNGAGERALNGKYILLNLFNFRQKRAGVVNFIRLLMLLCLVLHGFYVFLGSVFITTILSVISTIIAIAIFFIKQCKKYGIYLIKSQLIILEDWKGNLQAKYRRLLRKKVSKRKIRWELFKMLLGMFWGTLLSKVEDIYLPKQKPQHKGDD